ncbi:unnamed protein product [Paramecium primaurelia]|uniref:MORN repeat-containing protein 3 n=1 Tax=Paramecium primaurelia TaxID=5886 RepID=A0A8S1NTS9_PARPR|nr:unnamed protein product [Paramecium primaurelia]
MQSTNTSSPQKPSTASASKSIGPYRTIITTYAPFATTHLKNSKIQDSPIKKVQKLDDDILIKLIKTNREMSKKYSKSSDKIIIKDIKDEQQQEYIGSYNGKVREGFGKLFNAQGILIYEGQWFNDQQNGNGIMYNHDVNSQFMKYIGEFQFGQRCGAGIEYYRDGSMYVGNFEYDCRNGMGQLTKRNGEKLNGIWLQGKLISKI